MSDTEPLSPPGRGGETLTPEQAKQFEALVQRAAAGYQMSAAQAAAGLVPVVESIRLLQGAMESQIAPLIETFRRLNLSRPNDFKVPEANTAYSPEMSSPEDYFEKTEVEVKSFDELHSAIQGLAARNPEIRLLWRGQRDSGWGMHSQLFRTLMERNGVRHPSKTHRPVEPYPTEDQMIEAEGVILEVARDQWRLDGIDALEIFARAQHFGAPTRLLDVTRNPYVAAWFAVESRSDSNDRAGRVFALATHPVLSEDRRNAAMSLTQLKGPTAHSYIPFWHSLNSNEERQSLEWGTGAIRRYWIPPIYEQRISAQNAGFVLDGVPMSAPATAPYFAKPGEDSNYWKRADLLASSSIYTKLYSHGRRVTENKKRPFPPTFTFRLTPAAKVDIRKVLEERFSYNRATLYPDIEGLARYLADDLVSLLPR